MKEIIAETLNRGHMLDGWFTDSLCCSPAPPRTPTIPLALSHYGEQPLADSKLKWRVQGGPFTDQGELPVPDLKQGELTQAGEVRFVPTISAKGYKLQMHVDLYDGDTLVNDNDWSFWAFPEPPSLSADPRFVMRVNATNPIRHYPSEFVSVA